MAQLGVLLFSNASLKSHTFLLPEFYTCCFICLEFPSLLAPSPMLSHLSFIAIICHFLIKNFHTRLRSVTMLLQHPMIFSHGSMTLFTDSCRLPTRLHSIYVVDVLFYLTAGLALGIVLLCDECS